MGGIFSSRAGGDRQSLFRDRVQKECFKGTGRDQETNIPTAAASMASAVAATVSRESKELG
jgi:hypothetical protein